MAGLIVKSPYIKGSAGGKGAGRYLQYIGTRDGVELLPKNDAPDLSLQSGTALAALEGRAYPSASAPALA